MRRFWNSISAAWMWKYGHFRPEPRFCAKVKKDPYAYFCIFLDIEMPGLSGIQTAEELKKKEFLFL